jgi:hypothetical protein
VVLEAVSPYEAAPPEHTSEHGPVLANELGCVLVWGGTLTIMCGNSAKAA